MSSARNKKENELLQLVERAVESEGLTFGVLQHILQLLRESEGSLQHLLFKSIAKEYRGENPSELDLETAAKFGALQSHSEAQKELHKLAQQHVQVQQRLAEVQLKAESLQTAAELQLLVDACDSHARTEDYGQAAECIARGKAIMSDRNGTNAAELQMHALLTERQSHLAKILTTKLQQSISIYSSSTEHSIAVKASLLGEAWQALGSVEEDRAALAWLSAELIAKLFMPLLVSEQALSVTDSARDSPAMEARVLAISEGQQAEAEGKESAIIDCMDFLQDAALRRNLAVSQKLGKLLWPEIAAQYIERCLPQCSPHTSSEFLEFERQAVLARQMESCLIDIGFLEASADDSPANLPIHMFTQHHMDSCLHQMRQRLVIEARPLLLKPDYDTVTQGLPLPSSSEPEAASAGGEVEEGVGGVKENGVDPKKEVERLDWGPEGEEAPLLASGTMQISRSFEKLTALLERFLQEACSLHNSSIAYSTLLAFRDIAALVTSLSPVVHHRDFQVPLIAALYHNDCHFLAQQLLLLPHCYISLQQELDVSLDLQDAAAQLRQAGATCLRNLAFQQGNELRELLQAADNFRNVQKAQQGIKARKVIQQTLHSLGLVGTALQPVLAPHSFVNFGAQLLDIVASSIADDILAIPDISVEESEDLPRILQPFVEEAANRLAGSKQSSSSPSPEQISEAMSKASQQLQKLRAIVNVLEAKLVDIQTMWHDGFLKSCGLNSADVHHLVCALFEDTDLRHDVLNSLSPD